jgi:hypothetical protein
VPHIHHQRRPPPACERAQHPLRRDVPCGHAFLLEDELSHVLTRVWGSPGGLGREERVFGGVEVETSMEGVVKEGGKGGRVGD